jgi:hypothetical protein
MDLGYDGSLEVAGYSESDCKLDILAATTPADG